MNIFYQDTYKIGGLVRFLPTKETYPDLKTGDIGEITEEPFVYISVWWPRIQQVLLMKGSELELI